MVLAGRRVRAAGVIDAFRGSNAYITVQEYIAEAKGCDIRCLVVGNEVQWRRLSGARKPVIFRSNVHRGEGGQRRDDRPVKTGYTPSKAARNAGAGCGGCRYFTRRAREPLMMSECLAGTGRVSKDRRRGYRGANDSVDRTSLRLNFALKIGGLQSQSWIHLSQYESTLLRKLCQ